MAPVRWLHVPQFWGILFRRTYDDLERSIIPRSWELYSKLGGTYNQTKAYWLFQSGARMWFRHLQHAKDVHDHQSAAYQYIAFDELTTFEERQFRYMLSRARRKKDNKAPIWIRSGTNPDVNWVRDRYAPWVRRGPDYDGLRVDSGEILYYLTEADGTEKYVPRGTPGASSRQYIHADLGDNPKVDRREYIKKLQGLDPVQRARLLEGDWDALPAAGKYFQRIWAPLVDTVPANARRVRFWDRAATVDGGDWTAGVQMAHGDGIWFVEDVIRLRGSPHDIETQILRTAKQDGREVAVRFPQDPGQAGKHQARESIRKLAGYDVRAVRETGSKVVRFSPFSAQAEGGNVRVKRGPWNETYLQELEGFPEWPFDDQADATAGAFFWLTRAPTLKSGGGASRNTGPGFRLIG